MTPNKPTVVLSQPAASKPMAGCGGGRDRAGRQAHVSGQARPGVALRLYLNDSFVASVTAGTDGRFAVTINEGVAPLSYRVRIDEVGSNSGAVRANAEVPFKVPDTATTTGSAQTTSSKEPDIVAAQRPQLATAGTAAGSLAFNRDRAEDRDHHSLCGHPLRCDLGSVPARQMRLSAPDQSSTSGDRMLFHQRLPLDKGRRAALVGVPDPLIPLGLERKGLIEAFGGGRRCFLFPR